jgi:hypothetical protein
MISFFTFVFFMFMFVAALYFPVKWFIKGCKKHYRATQEIYWEKHPTVGYLVLKGVKAGKATRFGRAYGRDDRKSIEFYIDATQVRLHDTRTLFVDGGIPDGERFEKQILEALKEHYPEEMQRLAPITAFSKLQKALEPQ